MTNSSESIYFDEVIGHIESLVMEDERFQNILNQFLEEYYDQFDDNEENKIEYMEIHQLYTCALENFLVNSLNQRMGYFDMDRFASELEGKKGTLDGEIFDFLYTLNDFNAFKEMFLDYKNFKQGNCIDLSSGISVISYNNQM
ncbi:ADP-ribosylation factor-like protein 2-binding protein [Culicoides brevitarsis]|uniref:ADP-ribosylation factor-like protein 2-binding protein n=1 Tax=Culicoides brevitarsis TaxID=469753 RepID=UPI00307C7065